MAEERTERGRRSPGLRPRRVLPLAAAGLVVAGALVLPSLAAPGAPTALGPPRFVEEAGAAGIDERYSGDFPFFVGGGVAVLDCDTDGRPDLYLAGGETPAALYRNESPLGGAFRFERLADPTTDLTAVTGAYPIDIDGDRRQDLVVLRRGENVLLRALGDCRFERANERWGFDGGSAWTTAFSATFEAGASWPTLAFGNYLEEPEPGAACSPGALVRPNEGGDGFGPPIPLAPSWCTLSVLFSDWDRSGRRDLRVSNDRHYYRDTSDGAEQLWRIEPGAPPRQYTAADGWQQLRIWGMGIASYDLTGDGYPEYFLTSQGDNKLQTLAAGPERPTFADIALRLGVTAHRPYLGDTTLPSTAWHPEFDDLNNDGWVDLFITKGNVEAQLDYADRDPSNLLLGSPDGAFREAGEEAGIARFARSRGAAVVDLNGDGLLDIVVVNRRQNVFLWRNVGAGSASAPTAMGHWLAVIPIDPTSPNRDAIGAWLEVRFGDRLVRRERTLGGGHASGALGPIHVGLGSATRAEIRVGWPDGVWTPWQGVDADRVVVVDRTANGLRESPGWGRSGWGGSSP
ncbi:MAG TPA: CRTAC1 family protein [Candidatus Binatia bacterium]|nr:CRTAC1 family protein [Candidatus Binatia bacterium]